MPIVTMVAAVVLVVTLVISVLMAKAKAFGPLLATGWLLGVAGTTSLWILLG
jgi:hypothetical protein